MRNQTKKLRAIVAKFHRLKREIFGGNMFVVLDDNDPKVKQYNQLYRMLYLGVKP